MALLHDISKASSFKFTNRVMSTFKCGLRRFDGHGTSSYRPTTTAATKEMESAFQRMMREREQQDKGCFTCEAVPVKEEVKVESKKEDKQDKQDKQDQGECYSLSDCSPSKKIA